MAVKSFVVPPTPPPIFTATAESIISDAKSVIKRSKAVQDSIVAVVTPETATYANTFQLLVKSENVRLYERQYLEFYAAVSTDETIRHATEEVETLFSQFDSDTALRGDLYQLLAAVRDSGETADTDSHRLLNRWLLDSEQKGLALDQDGRKELREVNEALRKNAEAYHANCHSDLSSIWLLPGELAGIDSSIVDELEKGAGSSEGKLRLPLTSANYWPVLRSAHSYETRRQFYYGLGESREANLPILDDSIKLRAKKAHLLNYPTFSDLLMASNMETSSKKIHGFLNDLSTKLEPAMAENIKMWRALKSADLKALGEADDGHFYDWDRLYYSAKSAAEGAAPDVEKTISEYFELYETIRRMLSIYDQLFGLDFVEVTDDDLVTLAPGKSKQDLFWHEDVRLFAVWNDLDGSKARKEFVGYLYLDMHDREGKRPGYCDLPIRPGYNDANGTRVYQATCLLTPFDKATPEKPCLLTHLDVFMVFHELGHGIHDLVGKSRFARFSGASCADDFNETPSQLLEYWCWHPTTLRLLGCHYQDKSPLPDHLREHLVRSRDKKHISRTLAILHMSLFHQAFTAAGAKELLRNGIDTTELHRIHQRQNSGLDVAEDAPPVHAALPETFDQLNVHDYIVSQVYASDIFESAFATDPMNREAGLRYRGTIIGNGSSKDEMAMLTEFLGRPPNPKAFYKGLGIDA